MDWELFREKREKSATGKIDNIEKLTEALTRHVEEATKKLDGDDALEVPIKKMEMIAPVLFASFLLIITAVAQDLRSCYSVTMDAWTVFSKPHRFDMHQRNYNYSYGGKDSLCVRIRAEPSTIVRNTVTKNFTYLNMSSSPARRPSALINITFLEYAPERETKITYIHPKIVASK
ncbi:hypothetical protein MTO96_050571 [Rhipicephalus appendiculatus]